jgi:hypothetical protein
MKHIKIFEEFKHEYKGYLNGSLGYLHKHKKELESQIKKLDNKISNSKTILDNVGGRISRDSHKSRMQSIIDFKEQKEKLQEELNSIIDEISKFTKSKLDESRMGFKDETGKEYVIEFDLEEGESLDNSKERLLKELKFFWLHKNEYNDVKLCFKDKNGKEHESKIKLSDQSLEELKEQFVKKLKFVWLHYTKKFNESNSVGTYPHSGAYTLEMENLIEIYDIIFSSTHSNSFKISEIKSLLFDDEYTFGERPKENWYQNLINYLEDLNFDLSKLNINRDLIN